MDAIRIKEILMQHLSVQEIYVLFVDNHCQIFVIDLIFFRLPKLEQHKMIYAPLMHYIINQKIHAVSIQVFTPKEWKIRRQLYIVDNQ